MTETPAEPRSATSNLAFRGTLGCLGVFAIGALIVSTSIWRMNASMAAKKPGAVALAERFVACLYANDEKCVRETTTPEMLTSLTSTPGFVESIRDHLGARQSATPVEKSWSINSFSGSKGARTSLRFVAAAKYERDADAQESFILVDEGAGFLVGGFRVNSKHMFEKPAEH